MSQCVSPEGRKDLQGSRAPPTSHLQYLWMTLAQPIKVPAGTLNVQVPHFVALEHSFLCVEGPLLKIFLFDTSYSFKLLTSTHLVC